MVGRCPFFCNAQQFAHFCEQLTLILSALVGMNDGWNTKPHDNLFHNCSSNGLRFHIWKSKCLCPFCKVVRNDENVTISSFRLGQLTQNVSCYSLHRHTRCCDLHRSAVFRNRIFPLSTRVTSRYVLMYISL